MSNGKRNKSLRWETKIIEKEFNLWLEERKNDGKTNSRDQKELGEEKWSAKCESCDEKSGVGNTWLTRK